MQSEAWIIVQYGEPKPFRINGASKAARHSITQTARHDLFSIPFSNSRGTIVNTDRGIGRNTRLVVGSGRGQTAGPKFKRTEQYRQPRPVKVI